MLLAQLILDSEPATQPSGGGASGMGMMLMLLVLMAAGLAAALYFVRRGGLGMARADGKLKIEETRVLGGRQYLVVGKYGTERFLLGVCPGRIDYLCRLDNGEFDAALASAERPERDAEG